MTEFVKGRADVSSVVVIGFMAFGLVLALSFIVLWLSSSAQLTGWVGFTFMCATPAQIILALLWQTEYPALIKSMRQPLKGFVLLAVTVAVGVLMSQLLYHWMGDGESGITPMLSMYVIMTIVVTLWFVPVWHCWPISKLSQHPGLVGGVAFISVYLIAYVLYQWLFDFSFLVGAPFYQSDLDPAGLFNAWQVLTFSVTTVSVIMMFVLLDFWPSKALLQSQTQPWLGVVSSLLIFFCAAAVYLLFVEALAYDRVEFMVRYPVCLIFGVFLVNNIMQHQLFEQYAQPLRGLMLIACAFGSALCLYPFYTQLASLFSGVDPISGGPAYQLELWIASATLGVTFPIVMLVSEYFRFWPLISSK